MRADKGYFTIAGASNQTACPAGKYTSQFASTACTGCPAGFYCQNSATVNPALCYAGSFCLAGVAQPSQCAVGTYSSSLGNVDATACLPCTVGSYCAVAGLSAVTGPCKAGYYCTGGASTSQPLSPSSAGSGDLCTIGHYCPRGSSQPLKCPLGSYMPTVGAGNCTACTAGKYCGVLGLSIESGNCAAGSYCLTGASTAVQVAVTSTGGPCPVGYYCPAGTQFGTQKACLRGTYMNHTGASACNPTPAGTYSNVAQSTARAFPCPTGHYCPIGTDVTDLSTAGFLCPAGRYGAATMLTAYDDCTACPSGLSCTATGLTAPDGGCTPGYYCPQGSWDVYGQNQAATSHPCPAGNFCPINVGAPRRCPPGTFQDASGQAACQDCPAGRYCGKHNITLPSALLPKCAAGYWCKARSTLPNPTNVSYQQS